MTTLLQRLLRFTVRVVVRFHQHKGFLLASAVAFNALLSLVPLLGLVLVIISHFVDTASLLATIESAVRSTVPQSASQIVGAIEAFLNRRALASGIGAGVVIFFSAIAFRTLDDALSSIFDTRPHKRRHPVFSLVLPLAYMGMVVLALVVLSLLVTGIEMLPEDPHRLLGIDLSIAEASRGGLRLLGFAGLVVLLASFYRVMPEANVTIRHAVIGGMVAAIMWEGMRRVLAWYFLNVSLVGLIYGSLTTVIVLLLTFEVGAIILLFGGQVIAEMTRSKTAGLRWYEEPEDELS